MQRRPQDNYPFRAPKLTFTNPIYHPNFDSEGQVRPTAAAAGAAQC